MDWLFHLGLILLAAKLGAEAVQRLGMSAVVGEIAVGVLLGHSLLNVIPESALIETLAELGVLFMIFLLGLEMKVAQVLEVGVTALLIAFGGIVLPFAFGYGTGWLAGFAWKTSLFLGTVFTATSVAISARVFVDVGLGRSRVTRTILTAAMIDDILGLLVLTLVLALTGQSQESVEVQIGKEALFLVLGFPVAWYLIPRLLLWMRRLEGAGALFAVILGITLLFVYSGVWSGFEPIVGAFLIGIIFGQTPEASTIERQVESLVHFLAPIFFVHIGLLLDVSALGQGLGFALVLTLTAAAGKLGGAGGAALARRLPGREALLIGVGMIPRGEVGLIIASIGKRAGIFDEQTFSAATLMCILTVVIVPPFLRMLIRGGEGEDRKTDVASTQGERE
ncbi:MAG: cation:proton antiporter [Candidatus Binatia bacterium]